MKIYLVCEYDYEEHEVIAAFLDEDRAYEHMRSLPKPRYAAYDVEEHDVLDADNSM